MPQLGSPDDGNWMLFSLQKPEECSDQLFLTHPDGNGGCECPPDKPEQTTEQCQAELGPNSSWFADRCRCDCNECPLIGGVAGLSLRYFMPAEPGHYPYDVSPYTNAPRTLVNPPSMCSCLVVKRTTVAAAVAGLSTFECQWTDVCDPSQPGVACFADMAQCENSKNGGGFGPKEGEESNQCCIKASFMETNRADTRCGTRGEAIRGEQTITLPDSVKLPASVLITGHSDDDFVVNGAVVPADHKYAPMPRDCNGAGEFEYSFTAESKTFTIACRDNYGVVASYDVDICFQSDGECNGGSTGGGGQSAP